MTEEAKQVKTSDPVRPMFRDAFMAWVQEGRRNVKVEANYCTQEGAYEADYKIWCYDYDLQVGKYVENIDQLPSASVLAAMKIKEHQDAITELNKRLKNA